jgi:hypothetical protein
MLCRVSWRERIAVAGALAALVALSFVLRWHVLAASPYPLGVDGFFYPLEVRALLDHGALAYPPLTFLWMAPLSALTDPITGAKLAAALGGALIALPAYGVGARLGRSAGAGLIAAVLATLSAGSAYLTIEFVKQGVGLTVALAALWLLLRALETPSRGRIVAAVLGALATVLAHKLAAGVLAIVAVPAIAAEVRARLRGRRLIYATLAGTAATISLVVVAVTIAPLHHLFAPARWDLPALATRSFTLRMEHEPLIAAIIAVAACTALLWRKDGRPAERAAAWMFVLLALAIAIPWLDVADPQGLAFRLRIAAFVPLAMCGAVVAGALAQLVPAGPRVPSATTRSHAIAASRASALVALALLLAVRGAHERTEGRVLAHPALVAGAMAVHVPAGMTVIVPERHIAFMVAYYARVPVSLRPEAVPHDRRMRLVPLAFVGTGTPLEHAIDNARAQPGLAPPVGLHPSYRNGLVLIAEPTWDWILAQLPERDRRHYASWPTI